MLCKQNCIRKIKVANKDRIFIMEIMIEEIEWVLEQEGTCLPRKLRFNKKSSMQKCQYTTNYQSVGAIVEVGKSLVERCSD